MNSWLIRILLITTLVTSTASSLAAVGKGAQALLQNAKQLSLTPEQRTKIGAIVRQTVHEFNRVRNAERGKSGLSEKLDSIRAASQKKAVELLTANQKETWNRLIASKSKNSSRDDAVASRSLIIPTIAELKNPPSPNAFGPSTGLTKTTKHPTLGESYLILTDHQDTVALQALERLAKHRGGVIISQPNLGRLFQQDIEFKRLQVTLRKLKPRYVAIAPRIRSYRENLHLSILKLLAGLDEDPQLDAHLGYLIASNPASLATLIDRTISFKPLNKHQLKPASIGVIEDDDSRRYRSYQKAKVIQRMFADEGMNSPAIIITTRKSHVNRADFPKIDASGDNIAMMPSANRQTFARLSKPATDALNENNVLFMFGHGTPERIVGTQATAFAQIDFSNELVFCGSCMSASPYHADRLDLSTKQGHKRFAFHAADNGAVMMLGHMGLCGGFPKVYPMAEHVLDGLSIGEAYQRLMNALIGEHAIPDFYPQPAPQKASPRDPANKLLYILWGDPALVPIKAD